MRLPLGIERSSDRRRGGWKRTVMAALVGMGGIAAEAAASPPAPREVEWLRLGEDAVIRLQFETLPRPESVRLLLARDDENGAPPIRARYLVDGLRFFRRVEEAVPGGWEAIADVPAVADGGNLTLLLPRDVVAPRISWAVEITDHEWHPVARYPPTGWRETEWDRIPEAAPICDDPLPPSEALQPSACPLDRVRMSLHRLPWQPVEDETRRGKPWPTIARMRFSVREADTEAATVFEPARIQWCDSAVRWDGEEEGLRWRLYFTPEEDGSVFVVGEIEADAERRVEAAIEYMLPEGDWIWHDDIASARPLRGGGAPRRNAFAWPFGCGEQSRYPLGVVSRGREIVVFETVPESPRAFRIEAADGPPRLRVAFDLGLTPLTAQFPRRASFAVAVYEMNAAAGSPFRAAWERFQTRHPGAFRRRTHEVGLWLPHDARPTSDVEEFHPLWGCSAPARRRFLFSLPFHARWPLDASRTFDENEARRRLRFYAAFDRGAVGLAARTALLGGARAEDGALAIVMDDREAELEVNAHPAFMTTPSQPLNRAQAEWATIRAAAASGEYAGVYVAGAGRLRALDTNRAALAVASMPATWRENDRAIGLAGPLAAMDYLRSLARALEPMDVWLAVEVSGVCPPCLPTVGDVLLTGESPENKADRERRWNALRALAGAKPVIVVFNEDFEAWSTTDLRARCERCLLYGFLPAPGRAPNGNVYWNEPRWLERDRPLWRMYLPWLRRLAEAGWRPQGRAHPLAPEWRVEQFGPDPHGSFFLAARRPDGAPAESEIELALDAPIVLLDPLSGQCEDIRPTDGRARVRWRAPRDRTLLRLAAPWDALTEEARFLRSWSPPSGEGAALLTNLRAVVIGREAEADSRLTLHPEGRAELWLENRSDQPLIISPPRLSIGGRVALLTAEPRILAPGESATLGAKLAPSEQREHEWLEVRWRFARADREWTCARVVRPADYYGVTEEAQPGKP